MKRIPLIFLSGIVLLSLGSARDTFANAQASAKKTYVEPLVSWDDWWTEYDAKLTWAVCAEDGFAYRCYQKRTKTCKFDISAAIRQCRAQEKSRPAVNRLSEGPELTLRTGNCVADIIEKTWAESRSGAAPCQRLKDL